MVKKFDFLVIGSGIAGMSFALKVAHKGKVALVCKSGLEEANTYFAQGGVASVTNLLVDNFEKHIEDTMIAGDWISDRTAVEKVVREAPAQIQELISWGVNFDKNEKGEFDLHREGGHSEFRILHHKDNTGAVGMLQFEVLEYRLKNEYGVDLLNNTLPYSVARWIDGEVDIASLKGVDNAMIVKDNRDRTVVLISNEWQMGWVQERNPDVTFLTTPKLHHEL